VDRQVGALEMAMSLYQNIKIRFALLRKAIKLRRRLTQSEIDAVIAEVLEESKLLFGAVGAVVVVWAEVELHLDFINGVLVLQEPNANIKLPKPLQSRINFFKDALDRVPQLAHLRERASEAVDQLNRLKEVRHDIVHGMAIERLPDGTRKFLRLDFAGKDIKQQHTSYGLPGIVAAAYEMRALQKQLFGIFKEMLETLNPEVAQKLSWDDL
jgi:hypothetical protein